MKKLSLSFRLFYLKLLYAFFDVLTNITKAHPFLVRQKIYVGAAIIAVSVTINSCSSSGNHKTIKDEKKDSTIEITTLCYEDVAPVIKKNRNKLPELIKLERKNSSSKDSSSVILCYTPAYIENETDINDTLVNVEQMPQFRGGLEEMHRFIATHIKYPEEAIELGISGKVIIQFVVDKEGKILNPKVLRAVNPALDKEAIRIINTMPTWSPGKQNGRAVNVYLTIPIVFELSK